MAAQANHPVFILRNLLSLKSEFAESCIKIFGGSVGKFKVLANVSQGGLLGIGHARAILGRFEQIGDLILR